MSKKISCISPIDNRIIAEREIISDSEIVELIHAANNAQNTWSELNIAEKAVLCHQAIDALLENTQEIAQEISLQMGRPIQFCAAELQVMAQRARYMIDVAQPALDTISIENTNSKKRLIKRIALGVVFIIAPWNYPYLTAINAIIPALMAGNTVILKHSTQTLLCSERFHLAFEQAGLPSNVFQYCHCDHQTTEKIIKHEGIHYISFTGSISGGATIENSIAGLFKPLALELGGNDPAYVRADVEPRSEMFKQTVDNIVDGCFFNSGQSCCAVERIYVHEHLYSEFTDYFIEKVKQYNIANPLDNDTSLGPLINDNAATKARQQLSQAISKGATACIAKNYFNTEDLAKNYLAPQVLLNVDHSMDIMMSESFAPIVGIMKVKNDQQALELMNDSQYGLTASLWSNDENNSMLLADKLQTGTVFLNRCDYLDPALAWVGVKNSGRGCALSVLAYQQLTRPKSYYFQSLKPSVD
ncbi:Aldehyde dehydrogenase [hydrothermal vent metagenome]|uniref:Aldehyde dehydrogenase n=1 Tax=hydrothermal vent metagenome TaxID=652676 RepID=A0A3B1AQS2_9ZZZZ